MHHACTENSVQVHDFYQAFDFFWATPGGLEPGTRSARSIENYFSKPRGRLRALLNPSRLRGTDSPARLSNAARCKAGCNIFSVLTVRSVFSVCRQVWRSFGERDRHAPVPPSGRPSGVMVHQPQEKGTTSGARDLTRQSSQLRGNPLTLQERVWPICMCHLTKFIGCQM